MGLIDELRKSGSRLVDSLRGIDAFDESQKKPLLFPGVGERVTDTARGFGNKTMEVLNPGQSYVEPGLKSAGVNPMLAGAVGLGLDIATPGPGELSRAKKGIEGFQGFKDLTTKVLDRLKGKSVTSKQEILDLTNMGELKQAERDLIRKIIDEDYGGSLEPLALEARKYKSAEKFVKSKIDDIIDTASPTDSGKKYDFFDYKMETRNIDDISPSYDLQEYESKGLKNYVRKLKSKGLKDEPLIVIDQDGNIVNGNHRLEAYRLAGIKDIPVLTLDKANKTGVPTITNYPKSQLTDIWNKAKGSDKVPVQEFANKVKTELLPLKRKQAFTPEDDVMSSAAGRYESVSLPEDLRGPVANYSEHIYGSPIKTSAGDVHFSGDNVKNYFAHTRIEDLPEKPGFDSVDMVTGEFKPGTTRRVIEIQSDLFQKGRLEGEFGRESIVDENFAKEMRKLGWPEKQIQEQLELSGKYKGKEEEFKKLEPYRNTWHERVIREEVKQAAIDGKTKLQFPTGETAMKIEGLGQSEVWSTITNRGTVANLSTDAVSLKPGMSVFRAGERGQDWIITDVLGDGKFKAVLKDNIKEWVDEFGTEKAISIFKKDPSVQNLAETFDISGKVDTSNPIYRFYEKEVGKYLTNKYGAKRVKDAQGVEWYEVSVSKEAKKLPVEAFGVVPFLGTQSQEDK